MFPQLLPPRCFPSMAFSLFQLFPDPQDPAFHSATSKEVIQAPGLLSRARTSVRPVRHEATTFQVASLSRLHKRETTSVHSEPQPPRSLVALHSSLEASLHGNPHTLVLCVQMGRSEGKHRGRVWDTESSIHPGKLDCVLWVHHPKG